MDSRIQAGGENAPQKCRTEPIAAQAAGGERLVEMM